MELYATICANGKIPLGLYRISTEEKQEYIYNNPGNGNNSNSSDNKNVDRNGNNDKDCILRSDDQVYVTASKPLSNVPEPEPVKAKAIEVLGVGAEAEETEAQLWNNNSGYADQLIGKGTNIDLS